jgi:ribosomal subunit interface protein
MERKMQTPLQVSFRHMKTSEAIEEFVREKADGLHKFSERIISCHVVITAAKRQQRGNHHHVSISLAVPGKEIAVNREASQHGESEDIYIVLRDAFDSVRRQLEDYVRYQREDSKDYNAARMNKGIDSLMQK